MRLRMPEFDAEKYKDNPFDFDLLARKENAEILTELFNNIEGSFVMNLNSPWGTGKTTFIKMFRQHLLNKGFPSIYFNAWKTDYQDNPLITFIAEIQNGISELDAQGFEISKAKERFKVLKETGKNILKKSIPAAIKVLSYGLINTEECIEDAIAGFTSGALEDQINNYSATKDQVVEFKNELKNLVVQLQKKDMVNDAKPKPLIFFIDELDRCRPDYAIQVLEKIKHFFDVEGIIFVLGMDIEQLSHSIKAIYGKNLNIDGYLKRFIDYEFYLSEQSNKLQNYCQFLSKNSFINTILKEKSDDNTIHELAEISYICSFSFKFNLRDINQLFIDLFFVFQGYKKIKKREVALIIILLSIKQYDKSFFRKIISKEIIIFDLLDYLHKNITLIDSITLPHLYFINRIKLLKLKTISNESYNDILDYYNRFDLDDDKYDHLINELRQIKRDNSINEYSAEYTDKLFKVINLTGSFY